MIIRRNNLKTVLIVSEHSILIVCLVNPNQILTSLFDYVD